MECWRVFPVVVRLDDDVDPSIQAPGLGRGSYSGFRPTGLPVGLHILTQRHEEAQQTFNRKLPKLAAQHFG